MNCSIHDQKNQSDSLSQPSNITYLNKIFFNIKNGRYEIMIMWFLLIATIVLMLLLVISNVEDDLETQRVL